MQTQPLNGRFYLTQKWLLGILMSIVLAFAGFWMVDTNKRISVIEYAHQEGFSRLSVLESQRIDIERRLISIEGKIDELIKRR